MTAQAKGATAVAVTSAPGCKLESICDLAVVLPLVPTAPSHPAPRPDPRRSLACRALPRPRIARLELQRCANLTTLSTHLF